MVVRTIRKRVTVGAYGSRRMAAGLLLVAAVSIGCAGSTALAGSGEASPPKLDVPYQPTPPEVVTAMLQLAAVGPGDVVYDLGCGDGRIVVEAAKLGARGVGVDLDPQRIREARANAHAAGVEGAVELRVGDLFATDVRPATAVMLFLWPEVNLRLRPKLLAELRPGARVVSHWHDMGDWKPEKTIVVSGRKLYLWIIPPRPTRSDPGGSSR
jgi:SAM-dependent methyltransferase